MYAYNNMFLTNKNNFIFYIIRFVVFWIGNQEKKRFTILQNIMKINFTTKIARPLVIFTLQLKRNQDFWFQSIRLILIRKYYSSINIYVIRVLICQKRFGYISSRFFIFFGTFHSNGMNNKII